MSSTAPSPEQSGSFVARLGKLVPADKAFEAWTSGDVTQMLAALDAPTNPIDRHFLLQQLVRKTYQRRSDPTMRRLCVQIGKQHLAVFPSLCPALQEDFKGLWDKGLPRVVTFECLATVPAEEGEFDEAVEVCELAISYGRTDGTTGGFQARMKRIRKMEQKRDKKCR